MAVVSVTVFKENKVLCGGRLLRVSNVDTSLLSYMFLVVYVCLRPSFLGYKIPEEKKKTARPPVKFRAMLVETETFSVLVLHKFAMGVANKSLHWRRRGVLSYSDTARITGLQHQLLHLGEGLVPWLHESGFDG